MPAPAPAYEPEPRRRAPIARLYAYARPHRRTIAFASACSVVNKVLDLAPPALIGAAVDIVVRREASLLAQAGIADPTAQLWALGALTLVIWVLESLFEYLYQVAWRNLAQTIQHDLRLDAYSHAQHLEMRWFEDRSTGGLLAVLHDDVNQLERFLDGGANALIQVATTVLVIGALFVALTPGLAWVSVVPLPLVVWGSLRYQRFLAPRYAEVREAAGELARRLAQNLGAMATIKGFTAEDREVERVRALSDAYRAKNREAIRLSSAFSPLIRMVIVVGFLASLCVGGWLALEAGSTSAPTASSCS